jgi:hypothetical protein
MMNKRAIELQFHWIFILIAGAVIIAFFFSVAQKQQSLSERKLSVTLAAQMDAIFTGAIENKGTAKPLVTPQPGIAFSCTKFCECNYYVGGHPTPFGEKILFAPALLQEQDATAWAVEWKLPFRILNVLLLTNPRIKYYLVHDPELPDSQRLHAKVAKALPKEINVEVLSLPAYINDVAPGGDQHTRFVFLATQQPNLAGLNTRFEDEDVSGVWLRSETEAVFYEKTEPGSLDFGTRAAPVAGDALLYGAIFAADRQMYDCMVKSAFARMSMIAGVQARRAQELKDALFLDKPECAYDVQQMEDIAHKAGVLSKDTDARDALSIILGAQSELRRQNDNLVQQSCPELY